MKKIVCVLALAGSMAGLAAAQQIREIEFKNQPITDILIALSEMAGCSIVPDETVSGNASYYFTATDFETALKVFLSTYKMLFWKEGSIYYVAVLPGDKDADAPSTRRRGPPPDRACVVQGNREDDSLRFPPEREPDDTHRGNASRGGARHPHEEVSRLSDRIGKGLLLYPESRRGGSIGDGHGFGNLVLQGVGGSVLAGRRQGAVPRPARGAVPPRRAGVLPLPPYRRHPGKPPF
jgi:hypothetical protein